MTCTECEGRALGGAVCPRCLGNDAVADTQTVARLIVPTLVQAGRTTPQRETVRVLAQQQQQQAQQQRPTYSARFLRFLIEHWQDSDIEALRREWKRLPSGEVCDCMRGHDSVPIVARGRSVPGPEMPEPESRLDVELGYKALPMHWRGRTEVYLRIRLGWTGLQVRESQRRGEFEARHRRRVALESFMQPVRPQDTLRETGSPFAYMAAFLNGVPWRETIEPTGVAA